MKEHSAALLIFECQLFVCKKTMATEAFFARDSEPSGLDKKPQSSLPEEQMSFFPKVQRNIEEQLIKICAAQKNWFKLASQLWHFIQTLCTSSLLAVDRWPPAKTHMFALLSVCYAGWGEVGWDDYNPTQCYARTLRFMIFTCISM